MLERQYGNQEVRIPKAPQKAPPKIEIMEKAGSSVAKTYRGFWEGYPRLLCVVLLTLNVVIVELQDFIMNFLPYSLQLGLDQLPQTLLFL